MSNFIIDMRLSLHDIDMFLTGGKQRQIVTPSISCMKVEKIHNTISHGVWPHITTTRCWHCTHSFDTFPIGIPIHYIAKKFYLYGNFCSCQCALAFLLYTEDLRTTPWCDVARSQELLHMLYNLLYTDYDQLLTLVPAPPKLVLKDYGGCLTIEEYRAKFDKIAPFLSPDISFEPIVPTVAVVC